MLNKSYGLNGFLKKGKADKVTNEVQQKGKVQKKFQNKEKSFGSPLVKHREDQKWFEYQINEKSSDPNDSLTGAKFQEIFEHASSLLAKDNDLYAKMSKSQGGSEAAWLLKVVKKGTASDRMTAMQLQIHNSPVHSLVYAEAMISQLAKKIQREVLELLPILEETFLNHFLPPSRKLVTFSERPLANLHKLANNENSKARTLTLWIFEHQLKKMYSNFIHVLESLASGQVLDVAKKALRTAMTLLAERPEAEQTLLSMLANKLGHPNRHVGAHVARLLEELTNKQPNMKGVIVKEVERVIYRKNVHPRTHLYAATFLSQIELRDSESSLAAELIKIYFGLFKTIVSQRKSNIAGEKESNSRLLSILLSAANRALPYSKESASLLEDDINALYRVVNTASFSVALQTLKLLHRIQSLSENLADRFYSALYRKLDEHVPTGCYNQLMLLLFKSLKADVMDMRVRTFVKKLLQMATASPPPLAAGILILVSRLAEERRNLLITVRDADKLTKVATVNLKDDEEYYVDIGLDGKPIQKFTVKKGEPEILNSNDEASEKEDEDEKKPLRGSLTPTAKNGWLHKSAKTSRTIYDKSARNPLFIDCTNLADAELLLLSKHYHPSVAVFAQQMLEGKPVNYRGDPLEDFTLMKFLDRFAYRNPKENKVVSSSKVIKKKAYDPWGVRALSVTSKEYLSKKADELPPDERYLHRFAQLKFKQKEEQVNQDEWEYSSVNSEEFDAIIDRFEPGEANEEFDDVDFSTEFSSEKQKKKTTTKRKEESDGEDDELSDYGDMEDDEEDDIPDGGDEDDEEEDEDDDNVEEDGMDSDDEEERAFSRKPSAGGADFSDDDDYEEDVEMAADRFGAMLEDMNEEDNHKSKPQKKKTRNFKKRR